MPCIDALRKGSGLATSRWGVLLCALLAACAPPKQVEPPPPPVEKTLPPKPKEPALTVKDWTQFNRLAAAQMVKANPERTYMGPVAEPLKGIPILEIELHADGSIKGIKVEREPRPADAKHTTQLAIEAVRRAAPFPSVGHLPKPWKFKEVFLFDDRDRFKPRTLDE